MAELSPPMSIPVRTKNAGDRRKAVHYRLTARALFSWQQSPSSRAFGEGITRDVSTLGAYVVTGTCPPANSTIRMELNVQRQGSATELRLKSVMKVLRVEPSATGDGFHGFSAEGEGFSIHVLSKSTSKDFKVPTNGSDTETLEA
jgi:hypothetical protein